MILAKIRVICMFLQPTRQRVFLNFKMHQQKTRTCKISWCMHQEETHLAMISVPESDFSSERHINKVPHLFNRNFSEIFEKAPRKLFYWI